MTKFDLFLIFILVVLQSSYEILSKKNQMIEAMIEINDLMKDCDKFNRDIDSEIYNSHSAKIQKVMNEFDIGQANFEHYDKIKEIDKTLKPASKAKECITHARNATYEAVIENRNATSNCSSKPMFVMNTIKTKLESIMTEVDDLHDEICGKYIDCLMINDTTEILIVKCLREVPKLELNLTIIRTEYSEQVTILRAKEDDNLTDLRKCLIQIKDFNSTSKNIIETLTECVKKNSATNTYSKNILFFCLCLFCLQRMI